VGKKFLVFNFPKITVHFELFVSNSVHMEILIDIKNDALDVNI
jgi:hypothetical protein